MPGLRAGPSWRVVSPSGGSILTTSAPRSPSCWAAHGPSTTVVQSRILTPANGPAIASFLPLPPLDYHIPRAWCGNDEAPRLAVSAGDATPRRRPVTRRSQGRAQNFSRSRPISSVPSQLAPYPPASGRQENGRPCIQEAVMRGLDWRTALGAVIAASGLIVAAGAQAHDDDRWRWEHRHDHGHSYWHHEPQRRVVVEREVVERRPVYVAPAPVMVAPVQPAYSGYSGGYGGGPPNLNLNFNIPLR